MVDVKNKIVKGTNENFMDFLQGKIKERTLDVSSLVTAEVMQAITMKNNEPNSKYDFSLKHVGEKVFLNRSLPTTKEDASWSAKQEGRDSYVVTFYGDKKKEIIKLNFNRNDLVFFVSEMQRLLRGEPNKAIRK